MWGTSFSVTIYQYIGPYLWIYYRIVCPTEVQFKKHRKTLKTSALLKLHSMFNIYIRLFTTRVVQMKWQTNRQAGKHKIVHCTIIFNNSKQCKETSLHLPGNTIYQAPPSARNIKYTRMFYFEKKKSKIFSPEGPCENVWGPWAVSYTHLTLPTKRIV